MACLRVTAFAVGCGEASPSGPIQGGGIIAGSPAARTLAQAEARCAVDDRSKYNFSTPWFEDVRADWHELTAPLAGKAIAALEIGSFEGGSTT